MMLRVAFRSCVRCVVFVASLSALAVPLSALAQKQGGILRVAHRDSPSSMSIHEEGTISVVMPMMGVFNNLVVFDPKPSRTASTTSRPTSPPSGRGARTARR